MLRLDWVKAAAAVVWLGGCSAPLPPAWAPLEADGWEVREVEGEDPPSWVVYERDSALADVKEFRLVGKVHAEPMVVIEATRARILDDRYMPDGLEREILSETDDEIVIYGLMPLPLTLRDREVTERMVFSDDPETGEYRMDGREIETDGPLQPGVLRIPLVRNTVIAAPAAYGSLLTNDTVHDIGGGFPNWVVYAPTRNQLVEDLEIVRDLSR